MTLAELARHPAPTLETQREIVELVVDRSVQRGASALIDDTVGADAVAVLEGLESVSEGGVEPAGEGGARREVPGLDQAAPDAHDIVVTSTDSEQAALVDPCAGGSGGAHGKELAHRLDEAEVALVGRSHRVQCAVDIQLATREGGDERAHLRPLPIAVEVPLYRARIDETTTEIDREACERLLETTGEGGAGRGAEGGRTV